MVSEESFLGDVSGKIHGSVEDASDLDGGAVHSIKNQVFGDLKGTAATREIVPRFTAWKYGIVHNLDSCEGKELEVSGPLLLPPSSDGVTKDVSKVPFRKFR